MEPGSLCLVLHAHLPFVRHPEHQDFLEEDWLFEAISETYLPLLDVCERLAEEGVPYRLTFSVTPTLAAMLEDELLRDRYLRHIEKLIELSAREVERTRWTPEFHRLALRYHEIFVRCRVLFVEHHGRDLLGAFRRLAATGAVELVTSGATHGFLPLMLGRRELWRAQILTAVQEHRRHFGRGPEGIWLPECGFDPGVDDVLRDAGLRYFFSDAHGILHAHPRPRFGVHAPILTPNGVAAFGRDLESSRQVWCGWMGYPGDFDYREFYRDVGWDLDYEYVRPYLHADGNRTNLGIKYYRITGAGPHKEPYHFERAAAKADVHAEHFVSSRQRQARELAAAMGRSPLIVAPYDAELFGHWWFEGPVWLERVLRRIAATTDLAAVCPSQVLDRGEPLQVATPVYSSWGLRGYAEHWLDRSNDWIYPHLHLAGERMVELATRLLSENGLPPGPFLEGVSGSGEDAGRGAGAYAGTHAGRDAGTGAGRSSAARGAGRSRAGRPAERPRGAERRLAPLVDRALRQAGRELLLAQSSDWAFILKAGTMSEYAARRSREHLAGFTRLYEQICAGSIDEAGLADLEQRHCLFPELDWRVFARRP